MAIPHVIGPLSANGGTEKKHGFGMGQQDWENGYAIPVVMATGQAGAEIVSDGSPSLTCNHEAPIVAFDCKAGGNTGFAVGEIAGALRGEGHGGGHSAVMSFEPRVARNGRGAPSEIVNALKADAGKTGKGDAAPCLISGTAVRRLTPRECERLQGFEDDFTLIPFGSRKKIEAHELLYLRLTRPDLSMEEARTLAADGPRYKALGNSMAVPVMKWIGMRIQKINSL